MVVGCNELPRCCEYQASEKPGMVLTSDKRQHISTAMDRHHLGSQNSKSRDKKNHIHLSIRRSSAKWVGKIQSLTAEKKT
jgi:hypothetical protein